jgi:hypothetical protein
LHPTASSKLVWDRTAFFSVREVDPDGRADETDDRDYWPTPEVRPDIMLL